jgi:hypothetical protein
VLGPTNADGARLALVLAPATASVPHSDILVLEGAGASHSFVGARAVALLAIRDATGVPAVLPPAATLTAVPSDSTCVARAAARGEAARLVATPLAADGLGA